MALSPGSAAFAPLQLDKLLVSSLTRLLASGLGTPLPRGRADYADFVRVARDIAAKRPEPDAQHAFVLAALKAIVPPPFPALMRAIIAGLRKLGVPVGAAMAWGAFARAPLGFALRATRRDVRSWR